MPVHEPIPADALALFARLGLNEIPPEGPVVPPDRLVELARGLKDLGYLMFLYVAATHLPAGGEQPERLRVAYRLRRCGKRGGSVPFRVEVAPADPVPSLAAVFAGADWQEREQFDMVGVRFSGHPDLRRLLMSEDWEGHPLRKDYAIDTPHFPWR